MHLLKSMSTRQLLIVIEFYGCGNKTQRYFSIIPHYYRASPLTQTTSPQELLSQVAQSVAKISDKDIRQDIAAYTEILAGLKFEKDLIRQFLREDVMQESVIYQDILQKGEQKEALKFCMFLLDERFGEIDSAIIEQVKLLKKEQLESLGRAILRISSIPDLVAWLDQQERS